MKVLPALGILLLVLGLRVGDTKFTLQTESREKLPPAVGIIVMAGGALALVLGLRRP
jgi:hypothetical protein